MCWGPRQQVMTAGPARRSEVGLPLSRGTKQHAALKKAFGSERVLGDVLEMLLCEVREAASFCAVSALHDNCISSMIS